MKSSSMSLPIEPTREEHNIVIGLGPFLDSERRHHFLHGPLASCMELISVHSNLMKDPGKLSTLGLTGLIYQGHSSEDDINRLTHILPFLPIEEAHRLKDPKCWHSFMRRLCAYYRIRSFFSKKWKLADLEEFHRQEKFLIKVRDPLLARKLGGILAQAANSSLEQIEQEYFALFMEVISKNATKGAHGSMLERMLGGLRNSIPYDKHHELYEHIAAYHSGKQSLEFICARIFKYAQEYDDHYLKTQTYFNPYPKVLRMDFAKEKLN